MDVEIGFLLNSDISLELELPNGRVMRVRELAATASMATTMHTGIPETGHRSYSALGLWAEANAYYFAGLSREIFMQLPRQSTGSEAIVEVQIPVKKSGNDRGPIV